MSLRTARITTAACIIAAIAVVNAPRTSAQEAASVSIRFSQLSVPTGALYIGLYDSEGAFAGGKPVSRGRVEVSGDSASHVIGGLKPGRYAIKVFHDLDGDGKMETNAFGVPLEPYAASNNAPATMGPPRWADAAFEVGPGGASQDISVR